MSEGTSLFSTIDSLFNFYSDVDLLIEQLDEKKKDLAEIQTQKFQGKQSFPFFLFETTDFTRYFCLCFCF